MNKLAEMIKVADIHAARIRHAINNLRPIFPVTETTVEVLLEGDLLLIELLTNRFAKLQDYLGTKLIDAFFEAKGEVFNNLTMIDKINKLERLGIIDDANLWFKMRELRNHLAHEYPDHPEITAKYLNQVFEIAPQLLLLFEKIKLSAENQRDA